MDVSEMQKKLSQWAPEDSAKKFVDLYSLLCNKVWLRVAHNSVNSNQGRATAGIDGESMSNFKGDLEGNLEILRRQLKAKIFEPQPVRRVYIPKANGKKRPLGIPGIRDRIVQEALRLILEPIWEADCSQRSYGFRPNRSTYDAISYLSNRFAGHSGASYQGVIDGDITSYFDTIPHRRLIKAINRRGADKNIRALIWKFLRAGVMDRKEFSKTLTGTPQGGIISPLLANIYLHGLDKYIESQYLTLTVDQRRYRRSKGKGNYLYTRYADDCVVLCKGTKADAQRMKEELGGILENMGLKLSEEKTKITHITEGLTFLGYRIERSIGTRGKMVPKVLIPESAMKRFCHEIRRITAPNTIKESRVAKMKALNNFIRGWCQYYQITDTPSKPFSTLSTETFWGMAHWLSRKYQVSIPTPLRQYKAESTLQVKSVK